MECVAKTSDEWQNLSDPELHQLLKKYGLPHIPVTETTRNIIVNRLQNRIKTQNIKQKYLIKETKDKFVPISTLGKQPKITSLQHKTPKLRNCNDNPQQKNSISRYVLSPILATNDNEDVKKRIIINMNTEKPSIYADNFQFGTVGRLLSLRDSTLAKSSVAPKTTFSVNDIQKMPYKTNKLFSIHILNAFKYILMRLSLRNEMQTLISQALVWAFFTFFIVIALIYALSNPDRSKTIHEINTQSTVCNVKNNQSQHDKICVEQKYLSHVLDLNKNLFVILQDRARYHHCVNKTKPPTLSMSAFMKSQYRLPSTKSRPDMNIINDMKHLILNNPQWQIGLIDVNGNSIKKNSKSDLAGNEVLIYLLKPNLPILCVFYNKVYQFFIIVGIGVIIGCFSLVSCSIFSYIRHRAKIKRNEKNRFITEIINELSKNCHDNEIIVNHLRDKILPISDRKRGLSLWNEALEILKKNESRIQFALKLKNGENVHTIKWVGNVTEKTNPNLTLNIKQWQSPAFNNTNQIIRPPTSCLKIRHMFDATEVCNSNLNDLIFNAIIAKVGAKCKIVDIKLDKQTCCVYVRCETEEDAGIVHNQINGWWFDNRLLSIKFLRLERFITRFPRSDT